MTKKRLLLGSTLAALAFGASATGCFWISDDSIGRFCAAPASGEEHCVDSDHEPAAAWSQAEAHGAMPIQMWAKWPSSVTLDALVKSRARLQAWLDDNERVTSYVRDEQRNAEAYIDGGEQAVLATAHDVSGAGRRTTLPRT